MAAPEYWQVVLRGPDGSYPPRTVKVDIDQPDRLKPHMVAIARLVDPKNTDTGENWIDRYELAVFERGARIDRDQPKFCFRWSKD